MSTKPVLRWVFQRCNDVVTCGVDAMADQTYEVSLVPHRQGGAAVSERFASPLSALKRHAEVALQLREAGWAVTDRAAA